MERFHNTPTCRFNLPLRLVESFLADSRFEDANEKRVYGVVAYERVCPVPAVCRVRAVGGRRRRRGRLLALPDQGISLSLDPPLLAKTLFFKGGSKLKFSGRLRRPKITSFP